jgi:tetratricopeptide (TPR) repeat protein
LHNLLYAVHEALDVGEEWAVDFVEYVNRFLYIFGLNCDRAALSQLAAKAEGEVGSRTSYLARTNIGEQLRSGGHYQEAAQVFSEILAELDEQPSYERCVTLNRLGRCFEAQGQAAQAVASYRQGLAVAVQLETSEAVKRQVGALHSALANVLTVMGNYSKARTAYEAALTIAKEQDDGRQIGAVEGNLGYLAVLQGNLSEAAQRYGEAITTFQQLNEPEAEAVGWHQLGRVHQESGQWDAAEYAYREAARIREHQGNLADAVGTWSNLALLNKFAGKPEEAEAWFRRAIEGGKAAGNKLGESKALNNLANLLQNQPNRLQEARQLAEEALAIKQTLDSTTAELWTTYGILAEIAEMQQNPIQAKEYRRLSREAGAAFAGAHYELRKYGLLIADVVASVEDAEARQQLETMLEELGKDVLGNLMAAIHRIFDGERDEEVLCEPLYWPQAAIISAILGGMADPETLKPFLEGHE